MISASPHQYRKVAQSLGVKSEIVQRAIDQSRAVESKGLPPLLTLGHLAHMTGVDYKYLRSIVSRSHDAYKPFVIRKRSGGGRLIATPEPQLLAVQRWIAQRVLAKLPVHSASMAYAPGASPLSCARRHLGARWLVKFDIHDFFESISERRVYFVFRGCGYQPLVAFELARLCTRVHSQYTLVVPGGRSARRDAPGVIVAYDDPRLGHLPQGAPSSPMLANLASRPLDDLLDRIAVRSDLVYTRYSDDVIFSTDADLTQDQVRTLIHDVARSFTAFGHVLHRKKITVAPPGSRKLVLGLLVDGDTIRLSRAYRGRLDSHVRGIEKFGLAEHAASRRFASIWGMLRHVYGLLAHAQSVDATYAVRLKTRLSTALNREGWTTPTQ